MAIYAIGDVQGCYDPLMRLLEKIDFDEKRDTLWFVGDLVNRGKNSLEVLKFIYSIKESVISVLGNHDIRALASYFKIKKPNESLKALFKSNKEELLEWLRNRPLLYSNENFIISHAGIYPFWDIKEATKRAKEVEDILRSDEAGEFIKFFYENKIPFDKEGSLFERANFALCSFTLMRFLKKEDKSLDFKCKISPFQNQNPNLIAWFEMDKGLIYKKKIFGHWAALGIYQNKNVFGIDSGCVWKKSLSALKLDETLKLFQVSCKNSNSI